MQDEFPFTALEYAKMLGISKECLRGRRRYGKLEGEYTVKDNCYFYKRVRPDQLLSTPKNPPKRVRRRGAHSHGQAVQYPNNAFRQHNEAKMMAKLCHCSPRQYQRPRKQRQSVSRKHISPTPVTEQIIMDQEYMLVVQEEVFGKVLNLKRLIKDRSIIKY